MEISRRIESAEEAITRAFYRFGFAGKEHIALAEKLLAGPPKERFDRVIIDSPPVGIVSDAQVIAAGVDGTLIVLKAGQTSRDVARIAVKGLRDVNARVFGAVLNDLDLEDQRFGQYGYYYRYGYYYGDRKEGGESPQAVG